jgi:hypothetical protein
MPRKNIKVLREFWKPASKVKVSVRWIQLKIWIYWNRKDWPFKLSHEWDYLKFDERFSKVLYQLFFIQ